MNKQFTERRYTCNACVCLAFLLDLLPTVEYGHLVAILLNTSPQFGLAKCVLTCNEMNVKYSFFFCKENFSLLAEYNHIKMDFIFFLNTLDPFYYEL